MRGIACWAGAAALMTAASGYGQDEAERSVALPLDLISSSPGSEPWDLEPDRFVPRTEWLSLLCGSGKCELVLTALGIELRKSEPDDEEPSSQRLVWKLARAAGPSQHAVARLHCAEPCDWLQAGPVATLFAGSDVPRPPSPGTLEAQLDAPGGETLTLVPMIELEADAAEADVSAPLLLLELRSARARQTIGTFVMDGPEPPRPSAYLRWAGDLDRDGRIDLLVALNLRQHERDDVLLLSSLAQADEIVGVAARFSFGTLDSGESD